MPPTTTPMSATLKMAKCTKVVSNMSVTKPSSARSMRLPTAPPSSRARDSIPDQWGRIRLAMATTSPTDTTADRRVRTQVCSLSREKAAPVFWT